ncbi:putative vacuolar membrane transporter for cationic amino acids [Monosporozyma unispora]|nr:putative vacuolar membrane transporter for cationic amino acids [Kazachstania unispora]
MLSDNTYSIISNITGSISFFSSFISLFPQIIETYHDKTVDGISPYFLLCWLCGDITSLIGALMTGQLMFQIMLAIYFLCNDLFVCGQYYYYGVLHENKLATMGHEPVPVLSRVNSNRQGSSSAQLISAFVAVSSNTITHVEGMVIGIKNNKLLPPGEIHKIYHNTNLGILLSWMGASFYVGARIPQLIKNYQRKSTDGLSPFLFATTLLGNVTYNISIFTSLNYIHNDDKWGFINRTMPFIFGSAGTIAFDLIYFYQYYVLYADDVKLRSLERELLSAVSSRQSTGPPHAANRDTDHITNEETPLLA